MRKRFDYYSYLLKYSVRLKYFNWNYINNNKINLIFIGLSIYLFLVSSIQGIKSLNLPTPSGENPIESFSKWALSFNTGVIVITFLSLLSRIRPIYLKLRKASKIIKISKIYSDEKRYDGIKPQKGYLSIAHSFIKISSGDDEPSTKYDTIFYSPAINDYLIKSESIELVITNQNLRVQKFILDHFEKLKLFLAHRYINSSGRTLINENKLCLSEDIHIGKPIKCHKGTYFDTMLTNDIAGSLILDTHNEKTIVDVQVPLPIENSLGYEPCFKSISETTLNNNMGGSTIGFTSDNQLIFWIQSGAAQHSQGLIAPTGSGSCDYSDLIGNDFLKTIKRTMERELLEESTGGVDFSNIIETRVIGYFRWKKRGGLPQFVGITKLNLTKKELSLNKEEIREPKNETEKDNLSRGFTDGNLEDIVLYLQTRCKLPNLSVPLYYNLIALIDYIEKYPEKAKDFFFPER